MTHFIEQKDYYVGECIYCGIEGVKLTDEHVIPYALGGTMILRAASCENCRKITSRCERNPLKEHWGEIRAVLDFPSRKTKFSDIKFKLDVILRDETASTLFLTYKEVLGLGQFLEFDIPGFFKPRGAYTHGSNVTGVSLYGFGGKDIRAFSDKYNIKSFSFSRLYEALDFEIMITKIAYCFVVACWGIECFEKKFVLPAILGEVDTIGFWFGGDPECKITPKIGIQQRPNFLKIGIVKKKGFDERCAVVRLKFFANTDTPEYIVVVGSLKKDFQIPQ